MLDSAKESSECLKINEIEVCLGKNINAKMLVLAQGHKTCSGEGGCSGSGWSSGSQLLHMQGTL